MPRISPDAAVARARAALGLDEHVPGEALLVRRLDRPDDFYLVLLGERQAVAGTATVDASTGEIGTSAALPGRRPHLAVEADDARELAGAPAGAAVALVWRPCAASRSPLYPLWEVEGRGGPVYVDQQSAVWRSPPWEAGETRG